MEKFEMDDDTVSHAILTHERQLAVEKASALILQAEAKEPICDRMEAYFEHFEPGMNFMPINTTR